MLTLPLDRLFALNGAEAVVTAAAVTVQGCASLNSSYSAHDHYSKHGRTSDGEAVRFLKTPNENDV